MYETFGCPLWRTWAHAGHGGDVSIYVRDLPFRQQSGETRRTSACSTHNPGRRALVAAHLRAAEVDQFEPELRGVDEQIVGLQVAMADPLPVHVLERLEALEEIQAHVVDGEAQALLLVLERHGTDGLRHEVHHQMQERFVTFAPRLLKVVMQLDDALVLEAFHHLELAVVVAAVKHHLRRSR